MRGTRRVSPTARDVRAGVLIGADGIRIGRPVDGRRRAGAQRVRLRLLACYRALLRTRAWCPDIPAITGAEDSGSG